MTTNAKSRCDHEDNRYKVCAICTKKIVFGSNPRSKFKISGDMESLIKKFSDKDFDLLDSRFPKSICLSCKVRMYEINQGKTSRSIPLMPNYLDIQLLKETRTSGSVDECFCFICRIGKQKIHTKAVAGKGVKREATLISIDNGLFGTKKKTAVEKIDVNSNKENEATNVKILVKTQTLEICKLCFAEISKDKAHLCNRNLAYKNMMKKIESFPQKAQDYLLHELLATKAKTSNPTSTLQNVEMNLRTRGRNARVILNPEYKKPVYFSEEKLYNFVTNTGFHLNFKYLCLSPKLMKSMFL